MHPVWSAVSVGCLASALIPITIVIMVIILKREDGRVKTAVV